MKTYQELDRLEDAIADQEDAMIVISKQDALELIEQIIEQQKIINRWFGFMRFMAQRSQWARQINIILNEYLYGTNDVQAIQAAKRYAARIKMHNNHLED